MITKKELQESCNVLRKENAALQEEIKNLKEQLSKMKQASDCNAKAVKQIHSVLKQLIGPVVTELIRENLNLTSECDDGTLTTKLWWKDSCFNENDTSVDVYTPCGLDE